MHVFNPRFFGLFVVKREQHNGWNTSKCEKKDENKISMKSEELDFHSRA